MDDEARELVRLYALQNAVEHDDEAEVGAVIGTLMGEHPELREDAEEISEEAPEVVGSVNAMDAEERRAVLEEEAPEMLEDDEDEEGDSLPELPNLDGYDEVVMRFAPNPNGPPTIGSARGMVVNDEYVRRYDGTLVLRYDDTDPVNKRPLPDAYGWYEEDAEALGVEVDETYRASDRLETYYEHARELIEKGAAYVCDCPAEEFSERKAEGVACPHRDRTVDENLAEWERMRDDATGTVLRVKTDIEHKNPALRDWVAFRIVDVDEHPHPLTGDEYRVWPMLDFQSAVDDHLLGTTHIIRGKDLRDSEGRQRYVYDAFGWSYPEVLHWGRISVEEYGTLSTSSLAEAIQNGEYEGWDDPRVPTVRALLRRGIRGDALRDALLELGVSDSDVEFSMEHVYSANRALVDDAANRYFLVRDPVRVEVEDAPETVAHPPLHPDDDRGVREIRVGDAVLLEPDDLPEEGERLRLKSLYNVEVVSREPPVVRHVGNDLSLVREGDASVVHWASALEGETVEATLRTPEGDETGVVEETAREEVGDVVQFERVGFARVEDDEPFVAFFAHR
jgi:glutamyl-tRNA synthetase